MSSTNSSDVAIGADNGTTSAESEPAASTTSIAPTSNNIETATTETTTGSSPKPNNIQPPTDADLEKTAFPLMLHEIISDPSTDDCIHWLSCGTRFMISDKKKFAKDVLPKFYGQAKYTSFTRRLKRWSFTRVPSGPFMGAYFNPNFRRGEPELASRVRYDHPLAMSGSSAAAIRNHQREKMNALSQVGLGQANLMPGMLGAAAQYGMPMSNEDRAEQLMRQMGMMNGGPMGTIPGIPGAAPGALGNPADLTNLYRAMTGGVVGGLPGQPGQGIVNNPNLAATNPNVALQMAMAQEMMHQRQLQAMGMDGMIPNAQQQLQGEVGQPGAAPTPDHQSQLAALMQMQLANNQMQMANSQMQMTASQQPLQQENPSKLVSIPSNLSNFQVGNGSGQGNAMGSQQNSESSLSNNLRNNPNFGSLTTLTGGPNPNAGNPNMANAAPLLNFNSTTMGLPGAMGGGANPLMAGMPAAAGGNPHMMNMLLADYLEKQASLGGGAGGMVSQQIPPDANTGGGAPADNNAGGGGEGKVEEVSPKKEGTWTA